MGNRKFTFSVLGFTFILLVTTIGSTPAGALTHQGESADQQAVKASSAGPLSRPFLIGDLGDQGVDAVESAVAYNTQSQEYLVVWYNDRPGCDDIYGRRVSANSGVLGPRFFIAAGCPNQERRYPDVVYNSQHNEYLVVWEHFDGSYYSIHGRIVSATGGLPGSEFTISSGPALKNCYRPSVAYASTSDKYLVVWERQVVANISRDIEAQVLTGTGTLDGSNYLLATGTWAYAYGSPDLSYNHRSNGYLVVWEQLDKNASRSDIYGHLVHGSGTPMSGPDIEIMKESTSQSNPAVAALPIAPSGQYLVTWEYGTSSRAVCSRVVASDGTPATGLYVSGEILDEANPAVAGNESTQQSLAIWTRYSDPPIITADLVYWVVSAAGNWTIFGGLGGLFLDHSAVAAGKSGDFLVTFDEITSAGKRGIWGVVWGIRLYMPLVVK
jgi:hypothetical protein